jgi:carbon starvation protein CstA
MSVAVDLTAIASLGTTIALALFLLLSIAGIRLREETGAHILPMLLAIFAIIVVLVLFIVDTLENEPWTVVAMAASAVLAVALDAIWKSRSAKQDARGTRTPSPG